MRFKYRNKYQFSRVIEIIHTEATLFRVNDVNIVFAKLGQLKWQSINGRSRMRVYYFTSNCLKRRFFCMIRGSYVPNLAKIGPYITSQSCPQTDGRTDGRLRDFLRATAGIAIARLSHRNSVCLSVCLSVTRVDQAKTVQARIIKSSSSAAPKTLVSGSVTLFQKFHRGHPNPGP